MSNRIIELPDGGYAPVTVDLVAKTATVMCHDGTRVRHADRDVDANCDMHLSLVAALGDVPLKRLKEVYKVDETTVPSRPEALRVEYLFAEYTADSPRDGKPFSLLTFRSYCQERHRNSRGDSTWPEYWHAVMTAAAERAVRLAVG